MDGEVIQSLDDEKQYFLFYDCEINLYERSFLFGVNHIGTFNFSKDKICKILGRGNLDVISKEDYLKIFNSLQPVYEYRKNKTYFVTFFDKSMFRNIFRSFSKFVIIKNNSVKYG